MGEDNIYSLEWINVEKNGHMQVQLLCRHDATVEEGDSPLQRWRYYAETYVLDSPTETLTSRGKMPFLKRYVSICAIGPSLTIGQISTKR